MSTILFPSPIFGPVHSRRLGVSLGVNLLPADGKICNFDCIYCECGRNARQTPRDRMPNRESVREALEAKLQDMKAEGTIPDNITFAGNGEPTGHPEFKGIIEDTIVLRNRYAPKAQISVLTNATHILKDDVFEALMMIDNPLLKLDAADADYIKFVNRPTSLYELPKIIEQMKAFGGRAMIQTIFLCGTYLDRDVDNTGDQFVAPWLETLKAIGPKLVTIYTIDRETPEKNLKKASKDVLDAIAARVRDADFEVTVSY